MPSRPAVVGILSTVTIFLVGACTGGPSSAKTYPSSAPSPRTSSGAVQDVWRELARPLVIPRLSSPVACPMSYGVRASRLSPTDFGSVKAIGPGPIFALNAYAPKGRTLSLHLSAAEPMGSWFSFGQKWVGAPSYRGPVLVRGRSLWGPEPVGFVFTEGSQQQLRFEAGGPSSASGWRGWVAFTLVQSPGCYGFQIDGLSFSEIIVFRVVR